MTATRVFLSHSHVDRDFVVEIDQLLRSKGAEPYIDQSAIQPGDELPAEITAGITRATVFLLFWSAGAARSSWVDQEWRVAQALKKKIVPYMLDGTPLPAALEHIRYIERGDADRAHGDLLGAVFGKYEPRPDEMFPGQWRLRIVVAPFGSATYDLELRKNGQINGTGKIDAGGMFGMIAGNMSHLLDLRGSVTGRWSYEPASKVLDLHLTARMMGQTQSERIQIIVSSTRGKLTGRDLTGRNFELERM